MIVTRIKLMGIILYKVTQGNIMKSVVSISLVGCFALPNMVILAASDSLSQINFSS